MTEDYKALYEDLRGKYDILKENEAVLEENGMKLAWRDPKDLIQREKNSKKHGQKDLASLYASVQTFGFKDILLIEEDNTIIAGHGRDLIAIEMGKPRIPVIICNLDKASARAYSIAHNVTSRNSKFNDDNIKFELKDITKDGFDLKPLQPIKLDKWTADLDVPEFDLEKFEPQKREEITKDCVPDTIFPTDNDWGIPVLSLKMQATYLDLPVVQWGDIARKEKFRGTYHWYCEDDKFESMWKDPTGPLESNCINCVEPNFSNYSDMARAYVMGMVYKKRWIARYWQECGVFIFVDMNVNARFYDLNMIGVPDKWRAYCTRGYSDHPDKNISQYEVACARAGTDDIIFIVYGGGETIEKVCHKHGWLFIQDRRSYMRDEWTKMFNIQRASHA